MAEIRWTETAATWLGDIYDYIAQDSPSAAARVVAGIYQKAQSLKDFPELGHKYSSQPDGDIRTLFYGHYRIAYLVKGREMIEILGVFHGSMDIDRYLP
jgi:toxin ParE1/3/4